MPHTWIDCQYDDDGEMVNPEYASAPHDSFWWVDSKNRLQTVVMKSAIWWKPVRVARVLHPDE